MSTTLPEPLRQWRSIWCMYGLPYPTRNHCCTAFDSLSRRSAFADGNISCGFPRVVLSRNCFGSLWRCTEVQAFVVYRTRFDANSSIHSHWRHTEFEFFNEIRRFTTNGSVSLTILNCCTRLAFVASTSGTFKGAQCYLGISRTMHV